jgi:hypothetical protein
MLDLSYFQNQNSNVQGFFNGGTWQTWIKPRGAKLVNIICQGAGSGGGGGYLNTPGNRASGGSGGTGATARLTINANLLPDILYILPGIGGAGGLGATISAGAAGTAGSSGQNSFVTLIPTTGSVSNVVLRSGTTPATGGGGASTTGGTAGAGETISLIANNIFANLGTFTFQAGVAGFIGQAITGGGNTAPANFVLPGTAGGGSGTGGANSALGVFPAVAGAPLGTNGQNGIILYKPTLILYGGMGGGGSTVAGTSGGRGGDGAPGAGGGSGGGGTGATAAAVGGNGGKGGDGFIIITTSL